MLVALAESLRQSISGAVLLPNDAGWTDATCGFNLAVTQRPDLVVAATSADDVVESVRFAVDNGLPVAVQATTRRTSCTRGANGSYNYRSRPTAPLRSSGCRTCPPFPSRCAGG